MELREFAEQVLFATTLEEKLRCPEVITDECPGAAIVAPTAPGRPSGLQFRAAGSAKADFPGVHRLEQERERGRLLHFFGNHELLATELMALVLLRFPDAPPAFRRGVFQTLKDEQEHTRLYMRRMKACGLEFGELPVSGFFWRCTAPMENPIDYVATLCLTFEQANLDFARHFAAGFQAVGDAETASLLDRIYHDEIGHVAYGLKWFRRWKNPTESDWEAFCRTLKFPLSPQRAKGFALNVEGRQAAGFDPEFIAHLNVFAQSKGRTPNVFVFNPFAEGFIARGRSFTPTKPQAQLARDLENLPQFLCRQDDIVLVERRPSVAFLSGLKQAGFALPEFVELVDGAIAADSPLLQRKLGRLRPWAWGPESMELLEPLFANVTAEERSAGQRFNADTAQLYSKVWSAAFLRRVMASEIGAGEGGRLPIRWAGESWLCTESEAGVEVGTVDEALRAIAAVRARGHHRIVVKESLGLAGSNAIRLWEPEILATQRSWMEKALAHGRQLVIEPWLERELDFSVQLEMESSGLKLCGFTGLLNDRKGQFKANWAEAHHHRRLPASVATLLGKPADIVQRLQRFYTNLFALLESELKLIGFVGPLGIDAFVYRTAQGNCRLKPVVEINPRYTMGRALVELMKRTTPGSCGEFRLVSRAMAQAEGQPSLASYARSLCERHPVRLEGEPVPRLGEGAVCLSDPAATQVCLAVFRVERTTDALQRFQPGE